MVCLGIFLPDVVLFFVRGLQEFEFDLATQLTVKSASFLSQYFYVHFNIVVVKYLGIWPLTKTCIPIILKQDN